ncbi:CAP domain-containing protein [Nonomuraea pusilla]|uniref:Uncharacterized conserved protein YkwD, contains CAP (CSP/antigen 5/PR1) domain n=1 Tax=Nonomuraea pusilla TaxID=46177 RepID=A0A1H7LQR2_9ACTN|nr:CAP domain-containing protein [Nonomuraea pusilla]SEL01058.1 Uncharacterized conserved protein YkwD, contains CAP (CSP/antigen 5/PR1) domain [Nonomuraea pusilla]
MRTSLGVVTGLVGLAALSLPAALPAAAPAAADTEAQTCQVSVAVPGAVAGGRIEASATRKGCDGPALLRVRLKHAQPGPDKVVKSGATRTGSVAVRLACAPGTYYAFATDYSGHTKTSRPVKLTCAPGTTEENEVVRLTNEERAKGGCKPLKHDPRLREAAYGHSADMAARGYFDHTSQDGRDVMDRIRAAGFTGGSAWAENIAMGQPTPAAVVKGWMTSTGHRANIMNCSYTLIGVGAAKDAKGQIYWTQDFAAN